MDREKLSDYFDAVRFVIQERNDLGAAGKHILRQLVNSCEEAANLELKKALDAEREFARHVRLAVENLIAALRTSSPELHARAIDIGKRSLELENDREAFATTPRREKGCAT